MKRNNYMRYQYHQLENGLTVGIGSLSGSTVVTVLFAVFSGSKQDRPGKTGTAHFVEHMLFKGTRARPELAQVEREIERLGGTFNGFTVKDFTWFVAKVLNTDLPHVLEIFHDITTQPLFDSKEIEKEKQVVLEELKIYNDTASNYLQDVFDETLFSDTPNARTIIGTQETINNINRSDLVHFFRKHYVGGNAAIVITGGMNPEDVLNKVQTLFSDFPAGTVEPPIPYVGAQRKPLLVIRPKKFGQVQIAFGVRTPNILHPDHYVTKLMAILLGGNMSARLFLRLREELGIVYDVSCMAEARTDIGYFITYTGTDSRNVKTVTKEILDAYKTLVDEPISERELEDVKNHLINKKKILCEDSYFLALDIAKRIIFHKTDRTLEEYETAVRKITVEDIHRVARDIIVGANLTLVLSGRVSPQTRSQLRWLLTSEINDSSFNHKV